MLITVFPRDGNIAVKLRVRVRPRCPVPPTNSVTLVNYRLVPPIKPLPLEITVLSRHDIEQ